MEGRRGSVRGEAAEHSGTRKGPNKLRREHNKQERLDERIRRREYSQQQGSGILNIFLSPNFEEYSRTRVVLQVEHDLGHLAPPHLHHACGRAGGRENAMLQRLSQDVGENSRGEAGESCRREAADYPRQVGAGPVPSSTGCSSGSWHELRARFKRASCGLHACCCTPRPPRPARPPTREHCVVVVAELEGGHSHDLKQGQGQGADGAMASQNERGQEEIHQKERAALAPVPFAQRAEAGGARRSRVGGSLAAQANSLLPGRGGQGTGGARVACTSPKVQWSGQRGRGVQWRRLPAGWRRSAARHGHAAWTCRRGRSRCAPAHSGSVGGWWGAGRWVVLTRGRAGGRVGVRQR